MSDNGNNPNRIGSTAITVTTPRLTPQNDFGQVMARTLQGAAQVGGAVAGAFIPGGPVVSAAISGASNLASGIAGIASRGSAVTAAGGGQPGALGGAVEGKSEQWALLEANRLMTEQNNSFNQQYLALQNKMQQESREFTTISNIMKVRHDSAKAAINNIR